MSGTQGEWVDTDIDVGRLTATILCVVIVMVSIVISFLVSILMWVMTTVVLVPIMVLAILDYGRSQKVVVGAE